MTESEENHSTDAINFQQRRMGAVHVLERRRNYIQPESMQRLKAVRSQLPEIQRQYPYVRGVGFFGSRTRGLEKPESDLDLFYYVNETPDSLQDDLAAITQHLQSVTDSVQIEAKRRRGYFKLDLRKENLDGKFDELVSTVDVIASSQNIPVGELQLITPQSELETDEEFNERQKNTPRLPLSDLFLLAIGDDVYKARQYVFDKFKTIPDGNDYLNVLMQHRFGSERELTQYKNKDITVPSYTDYPKTVEQAEQFFISLES